MCISFLVFFLEWIRHMCQDIIPTKDSILYNTRYPINRNSINPFEFSREIHHSCAHPPFHVLPFDTTRNESRRPTCQTERKFESTRDFIAPHQDSWLLFNQQPTTDNQILVLYSLTNDRPLTDHRLTIYWPLTDREPRRKNRFIEIKILRIWEQDSFRNLYRIDLSIICSTFASSPIQNFPRFEKHSTIFLRSSS